MLVTLTGKDIKACTQRILRTPMSMAACLEHMDAIAKLKHEYESSVHVVISDPKIGTLTSHSLASWLMLFKLRPQYMTRAVQKRLEFADDTKVQVTIPTILIKFFTS